MKNNPLTLDTFKAIKKTLDDYLAGILDMAVDEEIISDIQRDEIFALKDKPIECRYSEVL